VKSFIRLHPEKLPDAFLAGNDISAIGCIQALKSYGYEIPQDVSVMGFDDIDIAPYYSPPLTTVRNQIARQGILAIDHLVRMIQEKEHGAVQKLQGELIVRGSSHVKMDRNDRA
jgi:LacI family purine nucleotide synthesis repressor